MEGDREHAGRPNEQSHRGPPRWSLLVANGDDYIFGIHTSAWLFDPTTETWAATGSPLATRRIAIGGLLKDGRVLVVGEPPGPGFPFAEVYDPATGTWSATGPIHPPLLEHALNDQQADNAGRSWRLSLIWVFSGAGGINNHQPPGRPRVNNDPRNYNLGGFWLIGAAPRKPSAALNPVVSGLYTLRLKAYGAAAPSAWGRSKSMLR